MIVGKLVRDRIPEIMRQEGKSPEVVEIHGERLQRALKDKLVEEATELKDSGDLRELIDVLEVVDALIGACGLDRDEIEAARTRKRIERGGFERGYFILDDVPRT